MKNPLERTCEEYVIQLLQTNSTLVDLDIRHFDDDNAAKPGIVVEAVQGDHRLDGPKGHNVSVSALWRGTTTSSEDTDDITDAISDTVFNAVPGLTTIEGDFEFLLLLDAMSGSRTNSKDLRKHQKTFSFIAKITGITTLSTYQYLPDLIALRDVDGVPSLAGVGTIGKALKSRIDTFIYSISRSWFLTVGSADPSDLIGQVAPNDHDPVTNDVHWQSG